MKGSVLAPRGLTGSQPNILLPTCYVHTPSRLPATCDDASDAFHDVIAAAVMDELFVLGSNTNRTSKTDSPPVYISILYFSILEQDVPYFMYL